MLTSNQRSVLGRLLCAASVLFVLSAASILVAGGFSLRFGPVRISSHSAPRDLAAAAACSLLALGLWGRAAIDAFAAPAIVRIERAATPIVVALALATFAIGFAFATRCACGSDPYGYVSQADLWSAGSLHVPQPLAAVVPWPAAEWTLSPLGYRPAPERGAIVPTYAPGLPIVMAAAEKVARTQSAVFFVVPLLGALVVWLTFLLGRQLDSSIVGLFGALVVASSATFLFHLILPMSDVPVTAWWLLAAVLVFRPSNRSAFGAGLASSAAVLTRPNLVPLAVVCAIAIFLQARTFDDRTSQRHRVWYFAAGALPGPLAVAWIQNALYGSPLASGYGRLPDIYAWANAVPNLRLYPAWIAESRGAFLFVGLLAPFVFLCRRGPLRSARASVTYALSVTGTVFLAYIFYSPFDNWTYTRFLLPAIPLMALLGVWVLFVAGRCARSPALQIVALLIIVLTAADSVGWAVEREVLMSGRGEQRYIAAGQYIASVTAPDALVLAMQHSGSIRYYSGRTTIRYDWLDGRGLDATVAWMNATNHPPMIVLDDWEEPKFRERFQGQRWGALDWPARVQIDSQPAVRVYAVADRDRSSDRDAVHTVHLSAVR